jgi:hypothetical protein
MGDPESFGAVQVITTLSGDQVVFGLVGYYGTSAERIVTVLEKSLYPYTFLA